MPQFDSVRKFDAALQHLRSVILMRQFNRLMRRKAVKRLLQLAGEQPPKVGRT
jgi:hypothetical protein